MVKNGINVYNNQWSLCLFEKFIIVVIPIEGLFSKENNLTFFSIYSKTLCNDFNYNMLPLIDFESSSV